MKLLEKIVNWIHGPAHPHPACWICDKRLATTQLEAAPEYELCETCAKRIQERARRTK